MFVQAAWWGLLASSGLLIGAVATLAFKHRLSHRIIAAIMGFGGGVLIAVLAVDLMESAFTGGGPIATLVVPATIVAFAAGGVLAMLAESMIPEAFADAQAFIGLITVVGFLVAFLITKVSA